MADILPLRQQSEPLPVAPDFDNWPCLEVFHYILPPDERGEAAVMVAPADYFKLLPASDIACLVEVGIKLFQKHGHDLAQGHHIKAHATIRLAPPTPFDVYFIYVCWMNVQPQGEWRH